MFKTEWFLFLFSILVVSETTSPPLKSPKYRDYVYNRKTDAFYKLHIEDLNKWETKIVCRTEGAKLMLPATMEDIEQVHGMLKEYPDIGSFVWVEDDGKVHDSAEEAVIELTLGTEDLEIGRTKCNVINRYKGEIQELPCYRNLPFVCKVEAKDAPYDDLCDVNAEGYDYYSSVGSCYKVPNLAYTWNYAHKECQKEGAHLVVINSELEHRVVWDVIQVAERPLHVHDFFFFLVGFRAERTINGLSREFKTIFNETLDQAGYNKWSDGEPNNYKNAEYCGSIFYNDGKFNDVSCNNFYSFVCEKEVRRDNKIYNVPDK